MLEIMLERAMAPDEMEEQPWGVCGAEFSPGAVLAKLATDHELKPTCHGCLRHLARRAAEEDIPAAWDKVYADYLIAEAKHPEPCFPTMEALLKHEARHNGYVDYSEMQRV
ncbi:MAG: hypothetical protein M3426_07870 [Actinomycetota bacterium]|nr:hypothetical protein [Actinomycetota bacterium]